MKLLVHILNPVFFLFILMMISIINVGSALDSILSDTESIIAIVLSLMGLSGYSYIKSKGILEVALLVFYSLIYCTILFVTFPTFKESILGNGILLFFYMPLIIAFFYIPIIGLLILNIVRIIAIKKDKQKIS